MKNEYLDHPNLYSPPKSTARDERNSGLFVYWLMFVGSLIIIGYIFSSLDSLRIFGGYLFLGTIIYIVLTVLIGEVTS